MKNDTLVIDTGVLVEFFIGSNFGKRFESDFLKNRDFNFFYISPLVMTELTYIFCRKLGFEQAISLVNSKLRNMLVLDENNLRLVASQLKCKYGIALADCYSIAAGELQDCPVLMKPEGEFDNLDLSEFPAEIIFLYYE